MTSPLSIGFNLPFSEAIAAAKSRGVVLPDVYYGQLQGSARQLAFTVSGLAGLEQIQQVKDSLDKAIESGQSFNAWKKSVDAMGFGLPKHRLDNIFRTNLQSQYMAGKWEQFERNKANRPYVMYDAINDSRVRQAHLALDGKIWPIDDPQLHTHSPPNGYRCRCSLISLSESQAQARSGAGKGLNKPSVLPDGITPANPDKGWDYSPRDRLAGVKKAIADRRNQCGGLNFSAVTLAKKRHNPPIWCQGAGADQLTIINHAAHYQAEMPPPKQRNLLVLPEGLQDKDYLSRFMAEFRAAAGDQVIYEAVTKHKLLISDELFTDHKKGGLKITKEGREKYLLYLADAIKNPDEVWLKTGEYQDNALYFLSRYMIKDKIIGLLAVFIEGKKVWTGWTGYQSSKLNYFETKRDGYLIYRRE